MTYAMLPRYRSCWQNGGGTTAGNPALDDAAVAEIIQYRNSKIGGEQHPELNDTVIEFRATPMRVDENYSFYYVNLTRLIVTGIIPFGALAMLNLSIYR